MVLRMRRMPSFPKGRGQGWRGMALVLVFCAVIYGFWKNTESQMELIGQRGTVIDETGTLSKDQLDKLIEDKLDGFGPYAARLVAHPGEGAFPSEKLAALPREARVLLAVGPEGGWTSFELELLAAHGFEAVSWGPRALRTDTACVVLLGLIHAALK